LPAPERGGTDRRDFDLLVSSVREAGALALTMFRQHVRKWIKPDGSPVTEADIAVDRLLRNRLQSARPSYGWLSEETPDDEDRLKADLLWIADPIDGTASFVKGADNWCIAAALVSGVRPVHAVVYRPVTEQLFEACEGEGAFVNGLRIELAGRAGLDGARIVGSGSALKRVAQNASIEPYPNSTVPLALRLCFVATGDYDAALSTGNKNDWDVAAGDLIVHEAGGRVTGTNGETYTFNRRESWQRGMVAARTGLHEEIVSIVGSGYGD